MSLSLFLLIRNVVKGPNGSVLHGERDAMLVAAATEADARAIAEKEDQDPCWSSVTPPTSSSCQKIGIAGEDIEPGVVMESFGDWNY